MSYTKVLAGTGLRPCLGPRREGQQSAYFNSQQSLLQ